MELIDKLSDYFKYFVKKFSKWVLYLALFLIALIIFRRPILSSVGKFLIVEDEIEQVEAIFVLGGNTFDRPVYAAYLYDQGVSKKLITLGANSGGKQEVKKEGETFMVPDALIMQETLLDLGVPEAHTLPLVKGTSTIEEAKTIYQFSKDHKFDKIIVVSDKFHTRRIHNVFDKVFNDSDIQVIITGCSHSEYNEDYWWKYEAGLLMVINEYIKLMYYFLKGY